MSTRDYYARMEMPCAEIGRALACSSDKEQAEVINAFARELRVVCFGTPDMQLCAISNALDGNGVQIVKELASFIALREEADETAHR